MTRSFVQKRFIQKKREANVGVGTRLVLVLCLPSIYKKKKGKKENKTFCRLPVHPPTQPQQPLSHFYCHLKSTFFSH